MDAALLDALNIQTEKNMVTNQEKFGNMTNGDLARWLMKEHWIHYQLGGEIESGLFEICRRLSSRNRKPSSCNASLSK